ncbi:MAG: hypothetical protein ABI240_15800 [Sphingomonas sp.]
MLILAAARALFHLGKVAMPPLYGLAVVGAGKDNPAVFTTDTIVVAPAAIAVQGVGASLSPTIGGWLARGSLALWIGFAGVLRAPCGGADDSELANT